ncbi:MAG TPA: hypothetical protein VD862_01105 [Candidatus Paceibacterota bacterium]|nr:hypothetical protein [Candidatus Paceibacterota bacterium]
MESNEIHRISMSGGLEVRLRVQTYDTGALSISTASRKDEPGEVEALAALDILRDYLAAEEIAHRALESRRGDAYVVDALIIQDGAAGPEHYLEIIRRIGSFTVN